MLKSVSYIHALYSLYNIAIWWAYQVDEKHTSLFFVSKPFENEACHDKLLNTYELRFIQFT